jgi:uncharacterized membrane protein
MKNLLFLFSSVGLFSFHNKNSGKMENQITQEQYPTYFAKHISISINRPAKEVYTFASNPMNLPKWARGLGSTVKKEGDQWLMDSPMGKVSVKFAEKNEFGVIDH